MMKEVKEEAAQQSWQLTDEKNEVSEKTGEQTLEK
jgi:hypothetical protein